MDQICQFVVLSADTVLCLSLFVLFTPLNLHRCRGLILPLLFISGIRRQPEVRPRLVPPFPVVHVDVDLREKQRHGLVTRVETAMNDGTQEACHSVEGDLEGASARGDCPNMAECDTREMTTPQEGEGDGAYVGLTQVATVVATAVTFVGVDPDAVCTVGTPRLADSVFEQGPYIFIEVIWITKIHVQRQILFPRHL